MGEPNAFGVRPRGWIPVAVVFALGAVFGAALCFAAIRFSGRPFPRHGDGSGERGPIERMTRELGLDPAQRETVEKILRETHGEVREIVDRSRDRIREVLRPDQRERFDRMRPPGPPGRPERP